MLQTAKVTLFTKLNGAEVKVKILLHSAPETSYASRKAQNILNILKLTPLNSEKVKVNTLGSEAF